MKQTNLIVAIFTVFLFCSCANDDTTLSGEKTAIEQPSENTAGIASTNRLAKSTYYVSPTGVDNLTSGTSTAPWQSLSYASQQAGAGSTIIVLPGVYTAKQTISAGCSGTATNPTVFKAQNTATSIADPASTSLSVFNPSLGTAPVYGASVIKLEAGSKFINIEGLKVANSDFFGINVDGEETNTTQDITVKNCVTFNTQGSGIYSKWGNRIKVLYNKVEKACQWAGRDSQGRASQECITLAKNFDFQIKGNEVYNSTVKGEGGEGIDAKGGSSNGEISDNYVHDLYEIGLYVDAGVVANTSQNIRMYNNKVYNTGGVRIAGENGGTIKDFYFYNNIIKNSRTSGFWIQDVSTNRTEAFINIYIVNNTFVNNGQEASASSGSGEILSFLKTVNNGVTNNSANWIIKNNIFYNKASNYNFSIRLDNTHPGLSISNNLFFDFKPSVTGKYKLADLNADPTSAIGNPLFVNITTSNFALSSTTSAAYNKGVQITLPGGALLFTTDFNGNTRGSAWDIGAHEL